MKIKKIFFYFLIILVTIVGFTIYAFGLKSSSELNLVKVNDITQSLVKDWNSLDPNNLPGLEHGYNYVILDINNEFVASTTINLNTELSMAIKNRDTIIDIQSDGVMYGRLIIFNDTGSLLSKYQYKLLFLSITVTVLCVLMCMFSFLYVDRAIFNPFRKLQSFSRNVAQGKLDLPLEMDRGNLFGAFTESFDLMRSELSKARENERKANQSKKELVASLSHDIKTPVASIKAVGELMSAKVKDKAIKEHLEIIITKADQINSLITNMFNATLEELQELKVTISEESSLILKDLIKKSDYRQKVKLAIIPECLIYIDIIRLEQVIDNIISNSYKYTDTDISVTFKIEDGYLEINFQDYGQGVCDNEIPLLFNKYYRTNSAVGKSGAGLGLYISKFLINKMSGEITAIKNIDGFMIKIKLLIV